MRQHNELNNGKLGTEIVTQKDLELVIHWDTVTKLQNIGMLAQDPFSYLKITVSFLNCFKWDHFL